VLQFIKEAATPGLANELVVLISFTDLIVGLSKMVPHFVVYTPLNLCSLPIGTVRFVQGWKFIHPGAATHVLNVDMVGQNLANTTTSLRDKNIEKS
jgi:hypothetical protein